MSVTEHSGPDRLWIDRYGGVVTASPRLAGEMAALGDTVVEYVRADLHRGTVEDAHQLASYVRFRLNGSSAPVNVAEVLERYPAKKPIIRAAKRSSKS